jgi:uncharacterized membrane protein YeaQ/YmgE (transglycosylase-associated protein family)
MPAAQIGLQKRVRAQRIKSARDSARIAPFAARFARLTPLHQGVRRGGLIRIHNSLERTMLHLIWSIIIGFVIGLIARAVMPGVDHMGFWMTSLVGIGGSLVGGFIGTLIKKPVPGSTFHPAGFLMSIIGALILLWAIRYFNVA